MVDGIDGVNGAGAPPAPANITPTPVPGQLSVNTQYIKDLSFENPNAPQSLNNDRGAPNVQVQVNVAARGLGQNIYEVLLNINATAKSGEDPAFIVELAYGGVFTLTNVPPEHVHPILLIECPRLLFPFARAILADATRDGGFPPMFIQPVDFVELYRQSAQQQAAAQAAPAAPT